MSKFVVLSRTIVRDLSLIHISEPTKQAEISYAVFCLKEKDIVCSLMFEGKDRKQKGNIMAQ